VIVDENAVVSVPITCGFWCNDNRTSNNFSSYMRIGVMEDAQGYYSHEEEIRGLHVSMWIAETESN
jgi:hypothetical protein